MGASQAVQAIRKRITKKPEVRRGEIMDAALRVFQDKGVANTTVADITEAAGVAKGTFYLYFDSKETLVWALKDRFIDDLVAHATSFAERIGQDDWWSLAEATVEGWIDFSLAHKDHLKVFIQEGVRPETYAPFAECEAKVHAMFVAGIQAGMDQGAFQVADPELAARFLENAIEGTIEHAIMVGEQIDRARLVAAAKELVRKTLSPPTSPS
jgi:AcrR family transcriptional regulator